MVMSDRSPSSASAITAKEVAATGQNPAASAFSRVSSSSSSVSVRRTSTAPARNTTATAICTILWGSRASRLPAVTASAACRANAAAVPANTPAGRYRVPSTRLARPELSGSSTAVIVANTITVTSRPDTRSPPPPGGAVARGPGLRGGYTQTAGRLPTSENRNIWFAGSPHRRPPGDALMNHGGASGGGGRARAEQLRSGDRHRGQRRGPAYRDQGGHGLRLVRRRDAGRRHAHRHQSGRAAGVRRPLGGRRNPVRDRGLGAHRGPARRRRRPEDMARLAAAGQRGRAEPGRYGGGAGAGNGALPDRPGGGLVWAHELHHVDHRSEAGQEAGRSGRRAWRGRGRG